MPDFREYRESTPMAPVPFKEAVKNSTRAPTREDFSVPAQWTLFLGLLVAALTVMAWLTVARLKDTRVDPVVLLLVAATAGLLASTGLYLWLSKVLWKGLNIVAVTERIVGFDLNRDGQVGEPEPRRVPQPTLRGEYRTGPARRWHRWELTGDRDAIVAFAKAMIAKRANPSERQWKKTFGGEANWQVFQQQLLDQGMAYQKNKEHPQQGIGMLDYGLHVMKDIAERGYKAWEEDPPTPLLTDGVK